MTSPSPRRPVTRTLASAAATALLIGALVATPTLTGTTAVGGGPAHADEMAAPTQAAVPSQPAKDEVSTEASIATPTASSYGAVSGQITDSDNNEPVSGIEVRWSPRQSTHVVRTAITDVDGRFRLGAIAAGQGTVVVNYTNSNSRQPDPYTERPNYQTSWSDTLTVKGGSVSHFDTSVERGAVLRGTIRDRAGKPYPASNTSIEIAYRIEDEWDENEDWFGGPAFSLSSDGNFTIVGLRSADAKVVVRHCVEPGVTFRCEDSVIDDRTFITGSTVTKNYRHSIRFDDIWDWDDENGDDPVAFEKSKLPKVSGSATVGSTVRANLQTWNLRPTKLKYRWLRDGKPIGGAVSRTYKVKKIDAGHRLSVHVTGSRDHFLTETRASKTTTRVTR